MCNITFPLILFVFAIVYIIGYFFVYKQNEADKKYKEKMKKIGYIGNGWF